MLTRRALLKTLAALALAATLAPDKTRTHHNVVQRERRIAWESPIFGECVGEMVTPQDQRGWIGIKNHSVTGKDARIHVNWTSEHSQAQP